MPDTLDLAQARTFVHLYETRSVTATAQLLHVTQPSVSYTLSKLRRRYGERLFVRTPTGLEPTGMAIELYEPLRCALEALDRAAGTPHAFDPATTTRGFTVMMSDLGELSFLPLLLGHLDRLAPRAGLLVRHLVVDSATQLLVQGRLDLAVTSATLDTERLVRRPFMDVDYAVLAAAQHPRIHSRRLSARQFIGERHVSVRGTAGHSGPVELIRRLGLESQVAVELTGFGSVPYVVAASDLLAIVPRHIGEIYAARHDVRVLALPWRLDPIEVAVYTRRSPSPALAWLSDLVVDVLGHERFS